VYGDPMTKNLKIIIFAFFVVGFAVLGIYTAIQKGKTTASQEPLVPQDEQLVGADVDEHGCIGSAGYLWCEVKQKCLRTFEESCEELPSIAEAEKSALLGAISDALVEKRGPDAKSLVLTITQFDGNYARGTALPAYGGGLWLAMKVDGIWKLIWNGNGEILCSILEPYPQYSTRLVPTCFSDVENKNIER